MAHEDLSESFKSSTETLSNQVRYVNYSLIAVVWLLGGNAVSGLMTNGNGLILLFILLSLFLDLCQYIWNTVAIFCYQMCSKKRVHRSMRTSGPVFYELDPSSRPEEAPAKDPMYITIGGAVFFFAKLAACLTACVMLAIRLVL